MYVQAETTHSGRATRPIRVLIIDDDPLIVELHRSYLERLDSFEVAAEAAGAREALMRLNDPGAEIDLLLLDVTMPDGSGIELLRFIRSRGNQLHAIVISGVREAESVRRAASLGVFQYLIKPFTFATFRDRLAQFREFWEHESSATGRATQQDIDSLFAALRPQAVERLPKGIAQETLELVSQALRNAGSRSAAELAEQVGMSRVAVRRYLEHLTAIGSVDRTPRLGSPGRPQSEYRWIE